MTKSQEAEGDVETGELEVKGEDIDEPRAVSVTLAIPLKGTFEVRRGI